MIGTVFHDRYEIIEKIGEGGMATVYKAKCRLLNRMVAVKVLHTQFTHDEDFIRRFQHEAQAAARLSHPNIVNIYDVGTEGQTHYIVMEYVEGINLKNILREEGALPVKKALNIAQQIASALIQAHQHDIVHCDIKPHNILLTNDGRVKVVDFGIARAVNTATLNQNRTVIGSVHYLAPEQAEGKEIDKRTDIYALGAVLYEMIIGRPPFTGENPIAIALKQIQEKVSFPADMVIPDAVKALILRAMEKDPALRYQSASEIWRDIHRCVEQMKEPVVEEPDEFHTQVFSGIPEQRVVDAVPAKSDRHDRPAKKKWSGKRIAMVMLLIIGVGVLFGAGVGMLMFGGSNEITVPDLSNKTVAQAEKMLKDQGLSVGEITREESDTVEPNRVIETDPPAGEKVKKGRTIDIIVSKGVGENRVPNLVGKTEREAEILLAEKGLIVGERAEAFSDTVPTGSIIEQSPEAGTRVSSDTGIDIVVSKGTEQKMVTLPDFRGDDINTVKSRLRDLKLIVGSVRERESTEFEAGTVIEQEPSPDSQIQEGSTVNLVVSKGTVNVYPLSFTVPEGNPQQNVQIVVRDADGTRTVYSRNHAPGDVINKSIQWTGSQAVLRIIIDGNVVAEQPLR